MTYEQEPQPSAEESAEQQHDDSEREPQLHPRIWIGSLLDYNNGRLYGDWVDAAQDAEALAAAARNILAASPTMAETGDPAEEFGIFDHDDFGDWKPGEYEDLDVVASVARGIHKHGPAFAAWADLHDADPDMLAAFDDAYLGAYDSPQAWAEQVMDETSSAAALEQLAEERLGDLARYVRLDSDAWVHDAWLSGDIHIVQRQEGGVWMFQCR